MNVGRLRNTVQCHSRCGVHGRWLAERRRPITRMEGRHMCADAAADGLLATADCTRIPCVLWDDRAMRIMQQIITIRRRS